VVYGLSSILFLL